jgi:GTPase
MREGPVVHYSEPSVKIQKVSVHLMITVQKTRGIRKIPTQLMIWRWPSQNTFGMRTVLYWTRSLRTQFGVSINVWRLAGDTLNITCNFLYRNHKVHRDFLIILYKRRKELLTSLVTLSVSMTGSGHDLKLRIQDWKMRLLKTGVGKLNRHTPSPISTVR